MSAGCEVNSLHTEKPVLELPTVAVGQAFPPFCFCGHMVVLRRHFCALHRRLPASRALGRRKLSVRVKDRNNREKIVFIHKQQYYAL
jgi:hypothetical protein